MDIAHWRSLERPSLRVSTLPDVPPEISILGREWNFGEDLTMPGGRFT